MEGQPKKKIQQKGLAADKIVVICLHEKKEIKVKFLKKSQIFCQENYYNFIYYNIRYNLL